MEIIHSLWRGEADVAGEVFTATGAKLGWEARPDIPGYVGARGPKMLQMAGEIGDGAITHGITDGYLEFCMARLADGAARSGGLPGECELVPMFEVELDEDRVATVKRLRPVSTIMAGGEYAEELTGCSASTARMPCAGRTAGRAGEPVLGRYVTDQMVDAFSIGGKPEHLADRVSHMASLGVRHVICTLRGDPTAGMAKRIEEVGRALAGVLKDSWPEWRVSE